GEVLLAVHRSYAMALRPVLGDVHALAHVTGGGIVGNLVRVLPPGVEAVVDAGSWPWPPLFRVLMRAGQVSREEMRRVFNLGVGTFAEGWHAEFGGPHAELAALHAAGDKARGATLVVTLEPCAHHGKTPPCTDAIRAAGIRRVVAAVRDPDAEARGGVEVLKR